MVALSSDLIHAIRQSAVTGALIGAVYPDSPELVTLGLAREVDWNGQRCYELTTQGQALAGEILTAESLYRGDDWTIQW